MPGSFSKNKSPVTAKENHSEEKERNAFKMMAFIFIQKYWRHHVSHQRKELEEKKCNLAVGKDKVAYLKQDVTRAFREQYILEELPKS